MPDDSKRDASAGAGASGGPKDPRLNEDEATALAAEGEDEALLGLPEDDDDAPAPETGLHALGQLGTGVVVVACLVGAFLLIALALGWIFN